MKILEANLRLDSLKGGSPSLLSHVFNTVQSKLEAFYLGLLSDLVKRDLIEIEKGEPSIGITNEPDSDAIKLVAFQRVAFRMKNKDYVEKLEAENAYLKGKIDELVEVAKKVNSAGNA